MTPLESICCKRSPALKTTSLAYTWVNQSTHKDNNKHKAKWELDLEIKISDVQWEKAYILVSSQEQTPIYVPHFVPLSILVG